MINHFILLTTQATCKDKNANKGLINHYGYLLLCTKYSVLASSCL